MPLKIHLGCGNKYREGWVNVDLYAPRADVREDLMMVEFPERSAEIVEAIHVIEHVTAAEGKTLIRRAHDWLIKGGRLVIETPCRNKCIQAIRANKERKTKRQRKVLIEACRGLLGGRSKDSAAWDRWLEEVAITETWDDPDMSAPAIAEMFGEPGAEHKHVWTQGELYLTFQMAGFLASVLIPQNHGRRHWRDIRVEGVRHES